jgi:thioredoxin reductase (NADPH)
MPVAVIGPAGVLSLHFARTAPVAARARRRHGSREIAGELMAGEVYHTDVAIIGAGPVGLFAIFECGMLKMRCHVVDALDMLGGQCAALYPEKPIYDIPGYPVIEAAKLIDKLAEQASPFHPVYHLAQQVVRLAPGAAGGFHLETSLGTLIEARAVVIAAGVGAFGPNRPPLAGIESFEGRSVFYLVKRREDFRGKRVVIAGGGDSAVDWALSLAEVAAQVMVVHRRARFRAAPESAARLERLAAAGKIELVIPYQLQALEGADGRLAAVIVAKLDGSTRRLAADVLLPFFGLSMNLGPVAEWGLNLERNHIAVAPATCESSSRGIFAIGDIASYPGKLKLILSGFAEAAMAAQAIFPLVHPSEALHFEYSTTKGVPGR